MMSNTTAALQNLIDQAQRLPSVTPRDVMRFAIAGYLIGAMKYDPNQPRDDAGRWSETGGGGDDSNSKISYSSSEVEALHAYKGDGYSAINETLRGTGGGDFNEEAISRAEERISSIDSSFDKTPPIENDMTVYRSVGADVFDPDWIDVGDVIQDDGFASTSENEKYISRFGDVIAEIRIPKGYKVINMDQFTTGQALKEREHLLPRGTKFKVISKDINGDFPRWGLEVIQ